MESADRTGHGAPMIEVPEVVVAGRRTGPVWFVARPGASFHTWMSQWTDAPVDGSLGGNALSRFRVTLDYPGQRLVVERPQAEPASR